MKYVILVDKDTKLGVTRVYPFLFPSYCTHKFVAEYMVHMLGMKEGKSAKVLSAGFCEVYEQEWQVEHGSESLNIKRDDKAGMRDYRVLNMPQAKQGIIMDGSCDE